MKTTTLLGVAVAALLLSGCTAETDQRGDGNTPPPAAPTAPGGGSFSGEDCGGLTTEALEQIFGAGLVGPEVERGRDSQNGVTWTDTGCDWENDAADLDLDLDIAVASDFPDGTVGCFEPGGVGEVTAVEGIGTQAWWKVGDIDEAEGTLRVCTDDALIDFEIDADAGSYTTDELRDKAVEAIRPLIGG